MAFIDDLDLDTLNSIEKKDTTGLEDLDLGSLDDVTKVNKTHGPTGTIIPGTGIGSDIPEIRTKDPSLYKTFQGTGLSQDYDLGETGLSESPDQGIFGTIRQTYRNLFGGIKTSNQARRESIKRSAEEARLKAYEGGQDIQRGDIVKGIGKDISAVVSGIAVPFTAVLNKEVTGKPGETVGKILGMPFEVLHQDIANGLAISGTLEKEDANHYAEGLATLALFGIKGGETKETAIIKSKELGDTYKRGDIPSELKSQFNKEALKMHPDPYLSKGFSKEVVNSITKNFAEYQNAFKEGNKGKMDIIKAETDGIVKSETSKLIQENLKSTRGSIDLGVFLKDPKELKAYTELKAEIKNEITLGKKNIGIRDLVSEKIFGMFINNIVLEKQIEDQMTKELFDEVGQIEVIEEIQQISIPEKTKVYFGGVEGGITGISKEKGILDVTPDIEYATRYQTKHEIQQKKPGELYEGQIDRSEVFSVRNINDIQNEALRTQIEKFTDSGKTEIRWEEIGLSKDGGKSIIKALKEEGYRGFTKLEREGIESISIFDEGLLKTVDLKPVKPKKIPKLEKTEKKLIANDIDSLRGINELKIEDKGYYDNFEKGKDEKYKLIKKLEGQGIIKETKEEGNLKYYSLTDKGGVASRGGPKEIAHYPISLYKKFEQGQKVGQKVGQKQLIPTVEKIKEKKAREKLATEIQKISKHPNVNDIEKLLNKYSPEIIKQATNFAVQKNMISKDQAQFFIEALEKPTKEITQAPTGKISNQQKLNILDMLGYDKLFKKIEDIKINVTQLGKSLKNIGARIHIVNAPEGQRVKLPFSLMGNKSATFKKILLPMIKKAIGQGARTYVEPFGGAGTVYYFAEEMIKSGIKDLHINHFDNEKYQVVKAIKDGKVGNVTVLVDSAYNQIIQEIGVELSHIPEIKEIMEEYGVEVGSKEFKELAEMSFYPQYAKQFFEERPDTKLAVKGETTTTFKEWLKQHLVEEGKKQDKIFKDEQELDTAVELILNDRTVFENRYPEISKKISTILDKYDNINIKEGDVDQAMLVSMSRHFRQRGDSGQKVVSASSGFQNVVNVRNKMIDGLTKYKQVFDKYGEKIHIYNQDGKEFISDMGKNLNTKETISYLDPPYVRTTEVYIKNQPEAIKKSLEEYADPTKIDQLFNPMKDTIMMFTNDINGKYFETLNKMLDGRMSKDIIGYREGTTPTSLVTTNEIAVKPKEVDLSYYKILKDSFTKDIMKSLKEGLLPKISKQLEKHIAKFEQHFMDLMQKKFGDLTKIQTEAFKGKEAFEKLTTSLETVVTGRERQAIIQEAKKWVKQNKVRGTDLVKMIDKINKLWIDRETKIREFRSELNKTLKSDKIDAEVKQDLKTWFEENYTEKKTTGPLLEAVEIVKKFDTEKLTPEEFDIYLKYLEDEQFAIKVNNAMKESIYNLDIDQIGDLKKKLSEFVNVGKDTRRYKELQEDQLVQEHIKTGKKTVKFVGDKPADVNYKSQEVTIEKKYNSYDEAKKDYTTKIKELFSETTPENVKDKLDMSLVPVHWILDEKMGLARMVYDIIEQGRTDFQTQANEIMEEYTKLNKKLKLNKKSFTKIALHGLSRRTDKNGIPKLVYELQIGGKDPDTKIVVKTYGDIQFLIQKYKGDSYLAKNEQQMYDFMQKIFTTLGKEAKEVALDIDNMMVDILKEYFPIKGNIKDNTTSYGTPDQDLGASLTSGLFKKVETDAGFLKKATGIALRPELNADFVFRSNVYKTVYYNHMQRPIRRLNQAKNAMKEDLGNLGYKYITDYVDRLARQGIIGRPAPGGRFISQQTRNVSKTFVSANPSSYIVQFSALLEGKSVGADINPLVIKNAFKNKEMIFEKSRILKTRDYTHVHGYEGLYKSIIDEITDKTMLPMAIVDKHVGMIIWYSIYKQTKRLGRDEKTAIFEADQGVKKTIADPSFFGKSNYHVENERGWGSLTTMFNTFGSNIFGNIRFQGGRFGKSKYGRFALMYMIMFTMIGSLVMADISQDIGRRILGGKKYPEELSKKIRDSILGFIPVLGSLLGWNKYGGVGSLSGFNEIVKGLYEGDMRAFLHGVGLSLGIPASHTIYKISNNQAKRKKALEKKRKAGGGSIEDLGGLGDLDLSNLGDLDINGLEDLNLEEFNF